jgi:hypothetical protein
MELVILSTFAAAVILIAELGDLARRDQIDRSTEASVAPRLAQVVGLSTGAATDHQPAATGSELDRAA